MRRQILICPNCDRYKAERDALIQNERLLRAQLHTLDERACIRAILEDKVADLEKHSAEVTKDRNGFKDLINKWQKFYHETSANLKAALERERALQREICEGEAARLHLTACYGGSIQCAVDVATQRGWTCYDEEE